MRAMTEYCTLALLPQSLTRIVAKIYQTVRVYYQITIDYITIVYQISSIHHGC